MKEKKVYRHLGLICIIVLQSIWLFYVFSSLKQGFHSDEVWNYAFANSYSTKELTEDNNGHSMMNCWMSSVNLKEYISVEAEHCFSYRSVLSNTERDLNPPFQYLILHTVCSFFPGVFSWYFCFAINLFSFIISQIYIYRLGCRLVGNKPIVGIACVILYGFSVGAMDIVIFMRIYALAVMFAVLFMYYSHVFFEDGRDHKKISWKNVILLFVFCFLGGITLHLFLFLAFIITLLYTLLYLILKKYKYFLVHGLTCLISALVSVFTFSSFFSDVSNGQVNGNIRYPFWMQFRSYWYFITRDLFGAHVAPVRTATPLLVLAFLAFFVLLILPIFFLNRKEKWVKKIIDYIKTKAKLLKEKITNIQYSLIVMILSSLVVVIAMADRSSIYYMGVYANRYVFVIYPFVSVSACVILYYLVSFVFDKQKISAIILIICALVFSLWSQFLPNNKEYLFRHVEEGVTLQDVERDANCILVLSSDWLVTCFAPELYDTNSYYATNYNNFFENNALENVRYNEPYYLILDESGMQGATVNEGQTNPINEDFKEKLLNVQDYIDYLDGFANVKKVEFVGKDEVFRREIGIFRIIFDGEED